MFFTSLIYFTACEYLVIPVPTGAEKNPENLLRVNGNISGIFIFISHVNSLVGILSLFGIRANTRIFCACKHSHCFSSSGSGTVNSHELIKKTKKLNNNIITPRNIGVHRTRERGAEFF